MASEADRKWRMVTGCRINGGIVDVEHVTDGLDDIQSLINFGAEEERIVDIKISRNAGRAMEGEFDEVVSVNDAEGE